MKRRRGSCGPAGQTEQVYLWVYVGDEQHPYQFFDYRLDRTRARPEAILQGFQRGLLSDSHSAYTALITRSADRLARDASRASV